MGGTGRRRHLCQTVEAGLVRGWSRFRGDGALGADENPVDLAGEPANQAASHHLGVAGRGVDAQAGGLVDGDGVGEQTGLDGRDHEPVAGKGVVVGGDGQTDQAEPLHEGDVVEPLSTCLLADLASLQLPAPCQSGDARGHRTGREAEPRSTAAHQHRELLGGRCKTVDVTGDGTAADDDAGKGVEIVGELEGLVLCPQRGGRVAHRRSGTRAVEVDGEDVRVSPPGGDDARQFGGVVGGLGGRTGHDHRNRSVSIVMAGLGDELVIDLHQ